MDITFTFFNDGDTSEIKVGFPQYSWGLPEAGEIEDFQTFINNEKVDVEYIVTENQDKFYKMTINAWYVKDVVFNSKEYLQSQVKYSSEYVNWSFHRGVEYLFGTGSSWKDDIGEMDIEITNHTDYWIGRFDFKAKDKDSYSSMNISRNGEKINIKVHNIFPTINDTFMILFESKPVFYNDYSIWGNINGKIYETNNLKLLTNNQLKLLRNSIYAFYGYQFKDQYLSEYFENYFDNVNDKPSLPFSEENFSETEKVNLQNIINEERSRSL
jgi:hypothetical protein